MESSIDLQQLFLSAVFHIPQYQRAYSWENENLEAFLEDLREQVNATKRASEKRYFLGTFLLHRKIFPGSYGFDNYNIVDGQQRLTTTVVFIASALDLAVKGQIPLEHQYSAFLKRTFIKDDVLDCHKFHTIREDEVFFRASIIRTAPEVNLEYLTPSQKLLDEARQYFQKHVKPTEWPSLLKTLCESRVMKYVVNNSADATQIFELQNDRGKRLTDLEAVKSFLMHAIYLNAPNPEERLDMIQDNFSHIFRTVEKLSSIGGPHEDSILSYYCVAFTPWKNDEWRNPKKLAKASIAERSHEENKEGVIEWIETFVAGLVSAFGCVKLLLEQRDTLEAFSDLFVLGRLAPFWPLVIKTWLLDQTVNKAYFEAVCRLLEIYSFRGYAMSNMRADGGQPTLYVKARNFLGNYPELIAGLKEMCEWYNIGKRFLDGLENPNIFITDKSDARYLLWKYENSLRRLSGQKQPLLSWRDYIEPKDDASRFSIEHITAQADPVVDLDVEWTQGEPKAPFAEIALNRLGNLVLDSVSPNAAKGKKDFYNKCQYFQGKTIYLSQQELCKFTNEKDPAGNPIWDVQAIKERHKALVEFAKTQWDFKIITCPDNSKTL